MLQLLSVIAHIASTTSANSCRGQWKEMRLGISDPGASPSVPSEALAQGSSIFVLPEMASDTECSILLRIGLESARAQQASRWGRLSSRVAEFTSNNARSEGRVRIPICNLPADDMRLFDNLLSRVCTVIDKELPSVAALFPTTGGLSLTALHARDLLEFSTREPAINVCLPTKSS